MKINNKILSIPPHISTNWGNITSIITKGPLLVIHLQDGRTVDIPGLEQAVIEVIFTTHANFLEQSSNNPLSMKMLPFPQGGSSPLLPQIDTGVRFNLGSMEDFGSSVFQHNPEQSQIPEIPSEILSKILAITKIISPAEQMELPKAEPHCNCVHCQLSRAAHQELPQAEIPLTTTQATASIQDDVVSDAELNFQQWEIVQTGEKLFSVTNRLEPQERYSVYLGTPIGCTCGKSGCEHTLAVLRS